MKTRNNTVLVTGAAGFIGSHLVKKLLDAGYRVIGVDNLDPYYSVSRKKANMAPFSGNGNFRFYRQDITGRHLDRIFAATGPGTVVHLAAKVGVRQSFNLPDEYNKVNAEGTQNLLALSSEYGINKFVFASSSSVYGNNKTLPFSESQLTLSQISPYARSKKRAEILCRDYRRRLGLKIIVLRLFTVYGPSGRPDMAPLRIIDSIYKNKTFNRYGTGDTERDYTYIADVVSGIIAAINLDSSWEIINLGSAVSTSLNEIIRKAEAVTGKRLKINELPRQKGDIAKAGADITKAAKLLKYRPATGLKSGLAALAAWYRQTGSNL